MKRAIRAHGGSVAYILTFALLAALAGTYILSQQRLQSPFAKHYVVAAEFPNSIALSPGLGQPANVAGVRVGQIDSATLKDGRSIVRMSIDPGKLRRVYANATATLHPNTPLADMQVDISPGGPPASPLPSGAMIPLARTQVPIQSDAFLNALDADTRDYLTALLSSLGRGLHHRGGDLRRLLRTVGPTSRQVRELSDALAARRVQLARLVHNLSILSVAAGQRDAQLGQVVRAGNSTFTALASQTSALQASLAQLPSTLRIAQRTLANTARFSDLLGPTLTALEPATGRLPGALREADRLTGVAQPVIHDRLRPLIRAALPVLGDLLPTTADLTSTTPDLASAFQVLRYVANELLHNQGGGAQSYLFWLAWFAHNGNSTVSTQDAHGPILRGFPLISCSSLLAQPSLTPLLTAFTNVTPGLCGS
ncbi:MAG: hypothetical protein NVS1B9_15010 [Solirubrobacteraceae bacterium]